jgi:hypothetical protein
MTCECCRRARLRAGEHSKGMMTLSLADLPEHATGLAGTSWQVWRDALAPETAFAEADAEQRPHPVEAAC